MPSYLYKPLVLLLTFSQLAVLKFIQRVLLSHGWLATAEALEALKTRGVSSPEEFRPLDSEVIFATCSWFDEQRGRVGPGVLVAELRAGGRPTSGVSLDREADYGRRIREWLMAKLPDVCKPDSRIVEWERRLHGDAEGDRLERETSPHPAAVVIVLRLHHRNGKGRLTVRAHGAEIRAAVRAFDDRAVADYELIAARRERDAAREAALTTLTERGEE